MIAPYILIVDDEADVRHMLRRFLATAGYSILEAETAEDAIRRVEEYSPVVAFCDVHTPGANGLWLADQIRSASPTTAVVLATGDSEVPANESLRQGVVAYLLKPLVQRDVLRALNDGMRWSTEATARRLRPRTGLRLTAGAAGDDAAEMNHCPFVTTYL